MISEQGYTHKTYADIEAEMRESYADKGYSYSPYDPISVLFLLVARALSIAYEALQVVYLSTDEDSARGSQLDILYSRFDIFRLAAQKTTGQITITGPDGTTVTAGSIVESKKGDQFTIDADVTIGVTGVEIVNVAAVEYGSIIVLTGDITKMISNYQGVTVTNSEDFSTGREEESDEEYRIRKKRWNKGTGTIESIRNALLGSGVLDCKVFSNPYPGVVDGRAPQSVEAVVLGGVDQKIIDVLGSHVSAGNLTDSTQTGANKIVGVYTNPTTSQAFQIEFSRPNDVLVWIAVWIGTSYALSEQEINRIRDAILSIGSSHRIGDDVILDRFSCVSAKINAPQELKSLTIKRSSGAGAPVWDPSNIYLDDFNVAKFDSSRVQIYNVVSP